jgi:solute:Na+ symporter, SSS family
MLREPHLHTLVSNDWLIFFAYLFLVFAVGATSRSAVKTGTDFFAAGRSLPAWICALAMAMSGLGALEAIAIGAAGARYGFSAALGFLLGGIPALLFLGLFMMPVYYGSGARTTPGYLGLRFDGKTRVLAAVLQIAVAIVCAGAALWVVARILQALRIFEPLFFGFGWPITAIFAFCVVLLAVLVLAYVLMAGLRSTMVNQMLQFALLVGGFLPVVWKGLEAVGGWQGVKAALPAATGAAQPSATMLCAVVGLVFAAGFWMTDFRVLQAAMAGKDAQAARRIPLYAAAACLAAPFLLVVPGAIAIGLPTPQNATVVRTENGMIYHEITLVPPAAAKGQGLVPARMDAKGMNAETDAAGHALLDYGMASPNVLLRFLPNGLAGLGIAALLACLMSGVAASVMAVSTVFVSDLYPSKKNDDEMRLGRKAAIGAVLAAIAVAFAAAWLSGAEKATPDALAVLLAVIAVVSVPQLATYLLGMFAKRTTSRGAFAGLVAGVAAAALHYGLTLPLDAAPGLHGGWIALYRYPGELTQCLSTAIIGFAVNAVVTVMASLGGETRPDAELKGLVYEFAPKLKKPPVMLAVGVLAAAVILGVIFA